MSKTPRFNEDYFKRPMPDAGGASAWDNNGAFFESARFASRVLALQGSPGGSALVVGCGRGWQVVNMRGFGVRAEGCDVSDYALEHSVCGAARGDVTQRLPYDDASFDLVVCLGLLSYLPFELIDQTLDELFRVSRKTLWTNTLVAVDAWDVAEHSSVMPTDLWVPLFVEAGWLPIGFDGLLTSFGYDSSPYQWHQLWERPEGSDYGLRVSVKGTPEAESIVRTRLARNLRRYAYFERMLRLRRG